MLAKDTPRRSRFTRAAFSVLAAAAVLSTGLCLIWALWSTTLRLPLLGEYEVYFEAARLRAGLPLYVDHRVGATDYGPVPSYFLVVYTPIWPAVLALLPDATRLEVARTVGLLLWFATFLASGASGPRRKQGLLAGLCVATLLILLLFGASGRPDTVALALAAAGLVRVLRHDQLDARAALLLALAPWLKPTVAAIALCTPLAALLVRMPGARRGALVTVAAHGAIAAVFWFGSHGAGFEHLALSNLQELVWQRELEVLRERAPFFFPLLLLAGFTAGASWRSERRARLLLLLLGGTSAACLIGLAKVGSSSNYWFEPCLIAVLVFAHLPLPARLAERWPFALAVWSWFALVQTATVRGIFERFGTDREDAEMVARARALCMPSQSSITLSDHGGIEWSLHGRPIVESYQMFFLLGRGGFSIDTWRALYQRPEARCFVRVTGLLQFSTELRDVIATDYERVWSGPRGEIHLRRQVR